MVKLLSAVAMTVEFFIVAALVKGLFSFLDDVFGEPVKTGRDGFRVVR